MDAMLSLPIEVEPSSALPDAVDAGTAIRLTRPAPVYHDTRLIGYISKVTLGPDGFYFDTEM